MIDTDRSKVPRVLDRAHGPLLADILDVLHGSSPAAKEQFSLPPAEELCPGELRVLRHLPTNLSRPEIAGELSVSLNTVGSHLRSIYAKLQVRDRSSAVRRARDCGCWRPAARASLGSHRIPVVRGHPPAPDHGVMDTAPAPYMIRIDGHLGAAVLSAFPALAPRHHPAHTVLTGLLDRSALYGVLAEIEALGLDLLELRKLTRDRTSP